jgi:large subunit ribosomal protein L15
MPLQRRIPKHGFTNIFRREFAIVNVGQLQDFPKDTEITLEFLMEKGLIKDRKDGLKVLGDGTIDHALTVKCARVSKQAKEKIEKAGGKVVQ